MKNLIAIAVTAASLTTLGVTAPAIADDESAKNELKAETPVVVEKDQRGKVTKVRIGDKIYDVCTSANQDSCIQPRAAGLKWGNRPLDYWPGKPASSMD